MLRKIKLLCLEDSKEDFELLTHLLSEHKLNAETVLADNEADYIKSLQESDFDVIVSDFQLPGYDAFAALEQKMKISPETPFVCFSGSIGEETAFELLRKGADDFVIKDHPRKLPHIIKQLLRKSALEGVKNEAEQKLHESKTMLELILNSAPQAIFWKDTKGRYRGCNRVYASAMGLKKAEDIIGKTDSDLHFSDKDAEFIKKLDNEVLKSKQGRLREIGEIQHADGRRLTIEISLLPLFSADNHPLGILGIYNDITDRRKKEQKIQDLNSLLYAIREINQTIVQETDLKKILKETAVILQKTRVYQNVEVAIQDENNIIKPVANIGVREQRAWEWRPDGKGSAPKCIKECLNKKEHLFIEDVKHYCADCRYFDEHVLHAHHTIPIRKNNDVAGILSIAILPEHISSDEEVALMDEIAQDLYLAREKYLDKEALMNSELLFRSMFESANVGKSITSISGKINVNKQFCKMLGYQRKELENKTWQELTPAEEIPVVEKAIAGLIDKDQDDAARFEKRYIHKNGSYVWGDVNVTLQRNSKGEPLHYYTTIIDITERKETAQALLESEEKFRKIFHEHSAAKIIFDPDNGNIVDANNAAANFYGWSIDQLCNMSIYQIETEKKENIRTAIQETRKQESTHFEGKHRKADSTIVDVEIFTGKVNLEGKVLLHSVIHDITARKKAEKIMKDSLARLQESEAHYRTVFNNTGTATVIIENDITISRVNKRFEELSGFSADEIEGKMSFLDFVHEADREKMRDYHKKRRIKGSSVPRRYEFKLIDKGKKVHIILIEVAVVPETLQSVVSCLDITQRKRIEEEKETTLEKLRISENHYKTVFNNTGTATGILEKDATVAMVNKKFEVLTGYTSSEMEGKMNALDIVAPEDKERLWQYHKLRYEKDSDVPTRFEFNLVDKYKKIHNVILEVALIPGTEQTVVSGVDITDQRIKELEIRKLSRAVEQSSSCIIITDLEGRIEYVNKRFSEVTGYSEKESLGKNPNILKSESTPDSLYKELWETIKLGKNWSGEIENKKKDGSLFWQLVTIAPLRNEMGNITHFVGIQEDITEKKKAELFYNILYNIASAVIQTNQAHEMFDVVRKELSQLMDTNNLLIAMYNEKHHTMKRVYGTDEMDNLEEWPVEQSFSGWVLLHGKPLYMDKKSIIKDKAEKKIQPLGTIPEYWMGVPITIQTKVVGCMFIQNYDSPQDYDHFTREIFMIIGNQVSMFFEKMDYQEKLISAKNKAEESDRLKSAFLANMSHEIRTPMNGIIGFMDILKNLDLTAEERQEYIELINQSGQRLVDTVNDIIEISRIEAGEQTLNLRETDITVVMQYICKFFTPQAQKKGITFSCNRSPETQHLKISTDQQKLESILTNLVKNAIKFTDSGSIELGSYLENHTLTFYVKDTGKGIPADHQKIIFDRFVQADMSLTRGYEGAGLGLSIVKAYTNLLNGTIKLESQEGKGSKFSVTIPVESMAIKNQEMDTMDEPRKESSTSKLKILVAEDDDISFEYLKTVLGKAGNTILRTITGTDTVEMIQNQPDISLVLMDIKMPDMDGIEATKSIREFNKEVIIIAQTAFALSGDRERALAAGCNEYVSKPIKKETLFEMIHKCMK